MSNYCSLKLIKVMTKLRSNNGFFVTKYYPSQYEMAKASGGTDGYTRDVIRYLYKIGVIKKSPNGDYYYCSKSASDFLLHREEYQCIRAHGMFTVE